MEPWLNQTVLPKERFITAMRRGTIDVLRHWLAAEGLPFDGTELERKALSGIDPELNGETPDYSIPGKARIVFKAFGAGFQLFERARVHHPTTRSGATLWLFCPLVAGGAGYRAGSLYVGLSCGDGPERRQRFVSQVNDGRLRIHPPGELHTPPTLIDPVFEHKPLYGWCWERDRWTGTPEDLIGELSAAMRASWAALEEETTVEVEPATHGKTASGGAHAIARALAAKGYRYSAEQIATFYTALKTKGFVILSGLSGTGKSRLATELAGVLGATGDQICLVPVRPDWRDGTSLVGYFNPVTGEYVSTSFLDFVLRANASRTKPFFVILDEMNLARVEYYFSDFLSVLESPRHSNGATDGYVSLHDAEDDLAVGSRRVPARLHLPSNLYITGTVNVDETTFTFSPKVLDRAFTLEFRSVDLNDYPASVNPSSPDDLSLPDAEALAEDFTRNGHFAVVDKERVYERAQREPHVMEAIRSLNARLQTHDLQFGYRIVDEILAFLDNLDASAVADGIPRTEDQDEALDAVLVMKVLPKFNGPYHLLRPALEEVLTWAGVATDGSAETSHRFPRLEKKLREMQRRGEALGHVSFS